MSDNSVAAKLPACVGIWPAVLAGVLTTAIQAPMLYTKIMAHRNNDYRLHIGQVRTLAAGEDLPAFVLARPLWHHSVLTLSQTTGLSFEWSAWIVGLLSAVVCAMLLAVAIQRWAWPAGIPTYAGLLAAVGSVTLMLVAPVMLYAASDGLYYLGYIGISNHHNATINYLKPFVALQLLLLLPYVRHQRASWGLVLLAAVVTVLSAQIKPNFLMCLLPALGLLTLIDLLRHERIDWRYLLLGFFLPGLAVMAQQFVITYRSGEAGMALMPLAVMQTLSGHLGAKLLLSLIFPLGVSLLYWPVARSHRLLQLGWLVFAAGAGYTYLLAETGDRFAHANFGWSGEIALFFLFVTAFLFWAEQATTKRDPGRAALSGVAYVLHVASGLVYYIHLLRVDTFL